MSQFENRNSLYQNQEAYQKHAFLHEEIAERMLGYMESYSISPKVIATVGIDTHLPQKLRVMFPHALLHNIHETHEVSLGAELVASNLYLQDVIDIERLIKTFQEQLAPNGHLIFSTIAYGSFAELVKPNGLMFNDYPDIKDLGNYLHSLGFIDTMMHIEKITLHYERLETLLKDLRVVGAPLFQTQFKGLRTPQWYQKWVGHMDQYFNGEVYSIDIDVLYGQTKSPPLKSAPLNQQGEAYFDIKQIKR